MFASFSFLLLNFYWVLRENRERKMAIGKYRDVENGGIDSSQNLEEPFLRHQKIVACEDEDSDVSSNVENGSVWMVLLSTFVAVCGSFEFGSCVSILLLLNFLEQHI